MANSLSAHESSELKPIEFEPIELKLNRLRELDQELLKHLKSFVYSRENLDEIMRMISDLPRDRRLIFELPGFDPNFGESFFFIASKFGAGDADVSTAAGAANCDRFGISAFRLEVFVHFMRHVSVSRKDFVAVQRHIGPVMLLNRRLDIIEYLTSGIASNASAADIGNVGFSTQMLCNFGFDLVAIQRAPLAVEFLYDNVEHDVSFESQELWSLNALFMAEFEFHLIARNIRGKLDYTREDLKQMEDLVTDFATVHDTETNFGRLKEAIAQIEKISADMTRCCMEAREHTKAISSSTLSGNMLALNADAISLGERVHDNNWNVDVAFNDFKTYQFLIATCLVRRGYW